MSGSQRLVPIVAALVGWLAGTSPATAQGFVSDVSWSRAATLAGIVVDETDAVVPEVSIEAMNTGTGVRRHALSGADGHFQIPVLPAGRYVVLARRAGFAPLEIRNVVLAENESVAIRIRLCVGQVFQSIDVTARANWLDSGDRSTPSAGITSIGAHITAALQQRLPLSEDRGFADALFLVPGLISGGRSRLHYVHGASASSTVVLIDGVDVTSNREGGPVYLQMGVEAVEGIEVRTAALDASVPATQGAVINVLTHTGSNRLQATAGLDFGARGWSSRNLPDGAAGGRLVQFDLSGGGPIVRGRTWFYGAGRQSWAHVPMATSGELFRALVPGWTPWEAAIEGHDAYGKLTTRYGMHHVSGFYEQDVRRAQGASVLAAGPYLTEVTGGQAVSAQWAAVWSTTVTTRVAVAYNDKTNSVESDYLDTTPILLYEDAHNFSLTTQSNVRTKLLASLNSEAGAVDRPASRGAMTADLVWYRRGARGSHQLQAGLMLEPRQRLRETQRYNAGGLAVDEAVLRDPQNLSAGYAVFHHVVYDDSTSPRQDLTGHHQAMYLQDTWRPTDRVTVGAGVRVDWFTDTDHLYDRLVRNTVAIGPRLSASTTLPARGVLRGSWGRVHESAVFGRYSTGSRWLPARRDLYDSDLDGTFETDLRTPRFELRDTTQVDAGRTQPYVNELTASYRQPWAGLMLDAGLVRREYRGIPMLDAPWDPRGSIQRYIANPWNYPVITDLILQGSRQTARLHLQGSYTRNWRHMAGTWAPGELASLLQPAAFPNNKGIGSTDGAGSMNGLIVPSTANQAWIDHSVRVSFAVQAPRRMLLAAIYQRQSGVWSGPIVKGVMVNSPGTDPQSYPLRFMYPTRGEGQVQLPAVHTLSLRAGHKVRMRWGQIDAAIDLFNPLNWDRYVSFHPSANQLESRYFGKGNERQRPRTAQASLRLVF